MSTANSNGLPRTSSRAGEPAPVTPQRRAAPVQDAGHILAQIPSLEPVASTPKSIIKRFDGRVISQSLSMKMVFGVGGAMVFGAILPFLLGRGSKDNHPTPQIKELPAWSAHAALPAAPNTAQTMAPAWNSSQAAHPPAAAQQPPVANIGYALPPQQPGEYHPANMNGQTWPQRGEVAQRVPLQQAVNTRPNDPRGNQVWNGQQGSGQQGPGYDDPRVRQADNRNDPAAGYRNDPGAGYRNDPGAGTNYRNDQGFGYPNNRALGAPPVDRTAPANNVARDRYDNSNYPPSAPQNGMMPQGNNGADGSYRYPSNPEPGVARFDGNITTPPGRTN
jgi:hypothetical protein